ncbi:salt tolerance down-regulator-domain-containing protein [Mariannaea sp. PMI_226]|nr:salt tolerance down-regulator-domain-containing protein [Mariannaea sp. PMI_226]
MPANNQKPASYSPASPRNTAKYTNKDGSKFITVPKGTPSESSLPSTPTTSRPSAPPPEPNSINDSAPAVNRKKQKRRQKAAAKAAAEDAANGYSHASPSMTGPRPTDYEIVASDDEHEYVLAHELEPQSNGHSAPISGGKKKNKKKKKKNAATNSDTASPMTAASNPQSQYSHTGRSAGVHSDRIWSTNNQEERERIKEFWLGLGEDERKSLVKVEKDAVLRKMKEQQKHTCSCTVCGRKRTAIEEELEGLYDAYYLELEQFANQGEGPPMLPPPRDFPLRPPRGLPSSYAANAPPSRGRIVEHVGDDEDEDELEEVYSDDEVEDDDYSDDEPPEEFHSSPDRDVTDFLTFGNSLQVKGTQLLESLLHRYGNMDLGGILTVADDLLKNDGKRFIEMMEQLAERRMAREEDAREHFSRGHGHPNGSYSTPHSHPPPDEDEYDDEEEEEEDYEDSQDEEYEDEEDQMTEEQRMEEGRRMFQIFAARMFEQRVLSAYKEKVAKERQEKLLQELEEESRQVDEQRAKKAKNAQKRKEKAAQKKQAQAEEKARREAEIAAQEAAKVEAEKQRVAEQKQRAEEKRKQKEAQKKAEEDARLKKEAEKQRRLQEQRDRQAEQERKAREAKERDKKLKEEQRQKEKDAREQKEREAQERKEKQERDKREKEARAAKALKEAQAAKEAKERAKEEKAAALRAASQAAQAQALQQPKRGQQQHSAPALTALPQHSSNPANYASPKIPVATPVISKAPTPIRPRTTSHQQLDSQTSSSTSQSATSQNPSPHSMTPAHMSPGPIGLQRKSSVSTTATTSQHSHSTSPSNGVSKLPGQSPAFQIPPLGMQPPPGFGHHPPPPPPPPGLGNRMVHDPIFPPGFRPSPNMMIPPPGISAPPSRGFPPSPLPPPGFSQAGDQFGMGGYPLPKDGPSSSHTRQSSGAFDSVPGAPALPIGRPTPIGRPGSISFGRSNDDKDSETKHLGSRALLDDDDPMDDDNSFFPGSFRSNQPPGPRNGFPASPFMEPAFPMANNPWGPPAPTVAGASHAFPPPGFGNPGWGAPSVPPGFGMGSPVPALNSMRPSQPRQVAVRQMMCQVAKELANLGDHDGYIELSAIKSRIETLSSDQSITEEDLLNLCDTEGNFSNGGGTFDIRRNGAGPGTHAVRWVPDPGDGFNPQYRAVGAPGEIGSPLAGYASLRGI